MANRNEGAIMTPMHLQWTGVGAPRERHKLLLTLLVVRRARHNPSVKP